MDRCPLSFAHNSKTNGTVENTGLILARSVGEIVAAEPEKWNKERRIG